MVMFCLVKQYMSVNSEYSFRLLSLYQKVFLFSHVQLSCNYFQVSFYLTKYLTYIQTTCIYYHVITVQSCATAKILFSYVLLNYVEV